VRPPGVADLERFAERMNLEDYSSFIAKSVAETGYDYFRPSACISSPESEEMCILDIELKAEGEKSEAFRWGASLLREGAVLFLAFRSGDRVVTVAEIREQAVVGKVAIRVNPSDET
jgi:hypothetical protein